MMGEYTAREVALTVIDHLERRREKIVGDEALVRAEVGAALEPIRREYLEAELPVSYFSALEKEITETLPAKWRRAALPFTDLEKKGYGIWRAGDVVARLTYVALGLIGGGLVVAAPFIPIWEKWFPFALAIAAWWLPDAQLRWQRRRYGLQLGQVVKELEGAQKQLDRAITMQELLPPADPKA